MVDRLTSPSLEDLGKSRMHCYLRHASFVLPLRLFALRPTAADVDLPQGPIEILPVRAEGFFRQKDGSGVERRKRPFQPCIAVIELVQQGRSSAPA